MWKKRVRPSPDQLVVKDDIEQARKMQTEAITGLIDLRRQAPSVRRMTDVLIDRQGRNHYIELLYQHVPRGHA